MVTQKLDRASHIPLYHQLTQILREQITAGEFPEGSLFPSEQEIIALHSVSRTTVRLALDAIADLGLIKREQGRGTFVAATKVRSKLPQLSSFTEEVRRLGREPGTKLLGYGHVPAPFRIAERLNVEPEKMILHAVRLRTADDKVIAVAFSWLNDIQFPQLRDLDYSQLSLYGIFEEQLGLTILKATQQVWADIANPEEVKILRIPTGTPVLRFARTTLIATDQPGGTPIETVEAAFIGDMYTVETVLYR